MIAQILIGVGMLYCLAMLGLFLYFKYGSVPLDDFTHPD